jgi:RluA family pseudouridine synthase
MEHKTIRSSLDGRFDNVVSHLCPELSRKKIKSIIDNGGAYLNQKRILMAKTPVQRSDSIKLYWEEHKPRYTLFDPLWLIKETKDFLVLNKPSGLNSEGSLTSHQDSLIALVQKEWKQAKLVHRLDKETSGVMIISLGSEAQKRLENLFKERSVYKEYHALVHGIPEKDDFISLKPIIRNFQNRFKIGPGKSAKTEFHVLERKKEVSYIKCIPYTGRTHQIRLHLMDAGYPILGDKLYSQGQYTSPVFGRIKRHMLHSLKIRIDEHEFVTDLAPDFEQIKKNS